MKQHKVAKGNHRGVPVTSTIVWYQQPIDRHILTYSNICRSMHSFVTSTQNRERTFDVDTIMREIISIFYQISSSLDTFITAHKKSNARITMLLLSPTRLALFAVLMMAFVFTNTWAFHMANLNSRRSSATLAHFTLRPTSTSSATNLGSSNGGYNNVSGNDHNRSSEQQLERIQKEFINPIILVTKFCVMLLWKGVHDAVYYPSLWVTRYLECQSLDECSLEK